VSSLPTIPQLTRCIEGFSGVEKYIENAIKITNSFSKFCALESGIKVELFLLCPSLFLKKFDFYYTLFKAQNLLIEFVIFTAFSI